MTDRDVVEQVAAIIAGGLWVQLGPEAAMRFGRLAAEDLAAEDLLHTPPQQDDGCGWKQRFEALQEEHRKAQESWDRTRERLSKEDWQTFHDAAMSCRGRTPPPSGDVDHAARYLVNERLVHCGVCAGTHWDDSCSDCHAVATDHAQDLLPSTQQDACPGKELHDDLRGGASLAKCGHDPCRCSGAVPPVPPVRSGPDPWLDPALIEGGPAEEDR